LAIRLVKKDCAAWFHAFSRLPDRTQSTPTPARNRRSTDARLYQNRIKFDWNSEDGNPNNETKKWINGYALFHFNFNFPVWKGIKGDAGVRNITDYVNKTHGPMPGREWYLGLGYQLNEN
jgi:outer membrane receptor for ferrienterochelin and colicin